MELADLGILEYELLPGAFEGSDLGRIVLRREAFDGETPDQDIRGWFIRFRAQPPLFLANSAIDDGCDLWTTEVELAHRFDTAELGLERWLSFVNDWSYGLDAIVDRY